MTAKRLPIRAAVGLTLLALVGAACSQGTNTGAVSDTASTSSSSAPSTANSADYPAAYSDVREAYHHMFATGDGLATAISKQKKLGNPATKAGDLRITLGRLLGEHAVLAAFAMQKGNDGSPDFEAAAGALDKNTEDLGAAIGSVYGKDAETAFVKQWRDHIRMFVDFTVGTASNDDAKREAALEELSQYKVSFGKFLGGATGLPAKAVSDALQEHVDQLTGALDTYRSGDYAKTYGEIRDAYHHMYGTADALAGSIADQKKLGSTTTKAIDLRVTVDRLLGEHALLAVFAMQKGADAKPDFEQIAGALDGNSKDLAAAIGSVYGKDAETAFLKQWRDHIRMFVDFTVGTASKDDAKREAALSELSQYKVSFGEFLGGATGLPGEAVAELLQAHVNQLTGALDSYLGYSK